MRKNPMKRFFSLLLAGILLICFLPAGVIKAQASSTLTLAQLREKFPHGYYWNHVDNPGADQNNQDGYSSTPCPRHGNIGSSTQTCNGFAPNGRQLSWQCMGYAEKLGYDATGYNPRNDEGGWRTYTNASALDTLKPGDIVRYDNHSIYVTGIIGETVIFTDCNYSARCCIRWDATISMSKLRSSFRYLQSAPFAMTEEPVDCGCSTEYAGTYKCTTVTSYLNIRTGHGTGYAVAGSIPPGGIVTVTEAGSEWAHVSYNGITGYASMEYLQKQEEPEKGPFELKNVSMNLGNSLTMVFYVPADKVTDGDYALITKSYADGRGDMAVKVSLANCSTISYQGADYYLAGFNGIAAKEMTDKVTCVVYNSDGTAISKPFTATVKAYAHALFTPDNSELNTLMADLLNYGAAAQNAFGYNTGNLANADLTEEQKGYATGEIDMSSLGHYEHIAGITPAEIALLLKSDTRFILYYDKTGLDPSMVARISYTNHNNQPYSREIPIGEFADEGKHLSLTINTLRAADLDTVVTVEIYNGTELISSNRINIAMYCGMNPDYPASIPLAKYCRAAYNFFH